MNNKKSEPNQSENPGWIYYKPEPEERKWQAIPNTESARNIAIKQGAMFFTWAAMSEPYSGNGQPEPHRRGDSPFDFDDAEKPERACADLKSLFLDHLPREFDLDPYVVEYFTSGGKGFHAVIPAKVFGADAGDPLLHKIYGRIAAYWCERFRIDSLDLSMYAGKRGKMFRIANVKRRNGRYKVPLTMDEVRDLSAAELLELSNAPRQIEEPDIEVNPDLAKLYQEMRQKVYAEQEQQREGPKLSEEEIERLSAKIPPCIGHIITTMPAKSEHVNFNKLVMILVNYFQTAGFTKETAWSKVERFIERYPHSETYNTIEARIRHWNTEWDYLGANDDYGFACSFVLGLHLPGSAFDCKECMKIQPADSAQWEEPTDLTRPIPKAPLFPIDCLPYVAANYATDEAERMQAPVDLIAIPMLTIFAGLIGKSAAIKPKQKDDWAERPCLWAEVIAPVSAMKSVALSKATAPLRAIQKELAEEDKKILEAWDEKAHEAKMRQRAWEKECDKRLKRDQDAELPPKPEMVEKLPPPPKPRRVVTNDATIEKLADLMTGSRGMSLIRDELAGLLLNMSRYNQGSDRQFYLECYSGGSYSVDRVSRGEQFIDDLYLNICGGIQPDVAKKLFSLGTGAADGLFERFGLMTYPEQSGSYQHVDRWPNKDKRELFNDMCRRLALADWDELLQKDEYGSKPFARFDGTAQVIFNKWLVEHMRQINSIPEDDPMGGMMGKARGLLVRLVLVIHLAAWAANEMPEPKTVEPHSLERALKLLEEYLIPMWKRIFAAFGKTAADDGAHKIAKWIKEDKITEVRVRDIRRKCWTGLSDDKEIRAAIAMLIAHRWLGDLTKQSKGGRPSEVYPVNPLVHKV